MIMLPATLVQSRTSRTDRSKLVKTRVEDNARSQLSADRDGLDTDRH